MEEKTTKLLKPISLGYLLDERAQLETRLKALTDVIRSGNFEKFVPDADQRLWIKEQRYLMNEYLSILNQRLARKASSEE